MLSEKQCGQSQTLTKCSVKCQNRISHRGNSQNNYNETKKQLQMSDIIIRTKQISK